MSLAEETQEEQGVQPEASLPSPQAGTKFIILGLFLAAIAIILYLAWRLNDSQRLLRQHEQRILVLQEKEEELKHNLEITAGQLDMVLNAVALARIQRDDGQTALRDMEDRLAKSRVERQALEAQVNTYQSQIKSLGDSLAYTKAALADAANLPAYQYPGSYEGAIVFIASAYPSQSEILTGMVEQLSEVSWQFGGNSAEEGFDSYGLAAYLLKRCGLAADQAVVERQPLAEILETTSNPVVGDLVQYRDEYYMFFFLDPDGLPFVAGMTPYGIQLFRFDFKETLQFFRVPYGEDVKCNLASNP